LSQYTPRLRLDDLDDWDAWPVAADEPLDDGDELLPDGDDDDGDDSDDEDEDKEDAKNFVDAI
jgi:hypothetical protein